MTDTMKPFYDYLGKERQALLTKLDAIERMLGVSPRTAEIRKQAKHDRYDNANYAMAVGVDET